MKKKFIYLMIIITLFLTGIININASTLNKIEIYVSLDKNGDAYFEEKWDMDVTDGTEIFKTIGNLGDKSVSDFTVTVDGNKINTLDEWDIDRTREEKTGTAGINYIDNGVELCWGFGNYGNHKFTINYKVENFITAYKGADASLWEYVLSDKDLDIEKVYIDIYSYENVPDNFPIWAFGSKGYYYPDNGHIHFENDGPVDNGDYVILLLKFEPETFLTDSISEETFDDLLAGAQEGTFEYDYEETDDDDDFSIVGIISSIVFAVISILFGSKQARKANYKPDFDYGEKGKSISKEEAVYFRDIPFKEITDAYYVCDVYSLNKKDADIIGAMLLKWIKEKQVKVQNMNEEKDKKFIFELDPVFKGTNEHEKALYSMFIQASKNNQLEAKTFTKWAGKNYTKLYNWLKGISVSELNKNVQENKLILLKKAGIFNNAKYSITDEFRSGAVKLAGLKNYINDFTILKERKTLEVFSFEDYLIYAQMFGIAKEAVKAFKNIYPELEETNNPYFDIYMYNYISDFSASTGTAISEARSKAMSYNSGGGGFSVGGGGGGFSGGGGMGSR